MPRPGVTVDVVDSVEGGSPILDTGQGFFVGATERGPEIGRAGSASEYKKKWGDRAGGSAMYDSLGAFFDEGGSSAIISRAASGTGAKGTIAFGTGLIVDAISAGIWGNSIAVVAVGAGAAGAPIQISIRYKGTQVELSPICSTTDEVVQWAERNSNYVRFRFAGGAQTLPVQGTTAALTSGTNGAALLPADYTTSLGRFNYQMGPGQVGLPGVTDATVMTALGNHLEDNDRVGVVDLAESADPMALLAARTAFNGKRGSKLILAIGSWLSYPSETPPATIVIPYSGTQMGMIARVDAGGDPAAVAAGSNAISNRALGLTKQFSDADRETLNAGGVNLGREMYGLVRTYGYRTAAGPDYNLNWTFFQESRVVMAIAHECNAAVEEYVFDTIDGLRHLFSKVENVLVGICNRYWLSGALFGASPGEGFRVDMSVNTVDTIKLGEIHAAVYVKTSKVAEWVQISIIKVPLERALAA